MKRKILILVTPILAMCSTLLISSNASAAVPNTVKYKAAYEGVYQCLYTGAYQEQFMASSGGAGMLKAKKGNDAVKLPYGLTDASDNNTNCKEILKGFNDNARTDDNLRAGLMQSGMWSETDRKTVKNYFAGSNGEGGTGTMGYKAQGLGNVGGGQTTSKLTITFDTSKITSETCRKPSGSTTLIGTQSFYDEQGKTYNSLTFPTITKDNSGNWFFGDVASNSSGINVPKPGSGGSTFYYFCNDESFIQISDAGSQNSPYYNISVTFTQYYMGAYNTIESSSVPYGTPSEIVTATGGKGWDYTANTGLFKGTITEGKVEDTGDFDDYKLTYLSSGTTDQAKATLMQTIRKLSATSAAGYNLSLGTNATYDALKLADKEIYSLYTYYVSDVFKYPVMCEGDPAFSSYNDSNSTKINWVSGKTCRIDTAAAAAQPANNVYGIDNSTKHFTKKVTIDDVVKALNALPANISEKVDDGQTGGNTLGSVDPDAGDNDTEQASPCSKAAGGLTWIICTVIQGVGVATNGMYDYIEQGFLQTKVEYMADNSGTHDAWETFRNFANIFFAIVLLIIILSQITGFGVNNYGIKKILPSLILVAVLVNVSFFLCQVAVDLSNIVGYGINDTFAGMGVKNVPDGYGNGSIGAIIGDGDSMDNGILGTLINVGGAGAAIVGARALVLSFPTWIWGFLLVLLSAAISIIFFFILLGVRQAGIIILVALAPVAIVCYALPNTKSIFNRWWKMFAGLLLVYPICGALMGGGQFASRLLLANIASDENGTFFYVIVAMLVQVVPFFFVPSIVKSSFAAMGNLGMKLSNFGRGISRGATGAIRKSDGFKNAQARGRARTASWAYGRNQLREKLRTKGGRLGKAASYIPGMGGISAAYRNSNLIGSGMARDAYNRRQADRINAIAAQRDADRKAQMTVAGGLAGAERRQNEELRKFHANTYSGDRTFTSDFDAQEAEYERAIAAVDRDPTNEAEVARLRALQDVIGSTPDGQDRIQRVLNRRLYAEQEAARIAGRPAVLSAGMQAAKETLMSDHGGFKSGNRGLAATLKDMNTNGDVFKKGTFVQTDTDAKGVAIYSNAYYGAQAAKGSAYELANANDDTLENMYDSIGSMSYQQLMDTYRNASEAITNDTIAIKPENEAILNKIRQEAWNQIQARTSGSPDYYDDQGRRFEHNVGSFYNYTDNNGTVHRYKRDASTGDFKEMGGAGEVVSSGQMMSASDNFTSQYGSNYRELHAGDSYKIDHRQYEHATMPTGWHQRKDGNWYNGNTRLTPDEVARAEEIRRYNNQVDIHNGT